MESTYSQPLAFPPFRHTFGNSDSKNTSHSSQNADSESYMSSQTPQKTDPFTDTVQTTPEQRGFAPVNWRKRVHELGGTGAKESINKRFKTDTGFATTPDTSPTKSVAIELDKDLAGPNDMRRVSTFSSKPTRSPVISTMLSNRPLYSKENATPRRKRHGPFTTSSDADDWSIASPTIDLENECLPVNPEQSPAARAAWKKARREKSERLRQRNIRKIEGMPDIVVDLEPEMASDHRGELQITQTTETFAETAHNTAKALDKPVTIPLALSSEELAVVELSEYDQTKLLGEELIDHEAILRGLEYDLEVRDKAFRHKQDQLARAHESRRRQNGGVQRSRKTEPIQVDRSSVQKGVKRQRAGISNAKENIARFEDIKNEIKSEDDDLTQPALSSSAHRVRHPDYLALSEKDQRKLERFQATKYQSKIDRQKNLDAPESSSQSQRRQAGPGCFKPLCGKPDLTRAIPSAVSPEASLKGKRNHSRTLGELAPEDIWLTGWRDEGKEWPVIVEAFERITGKCRSSDTLRRRYRQVKNALVENDIEQDLLSRVSSNDDDAIEELNQRIHHEGSSSSTAQGTPNRASKGPTLVPASALPPISGSSGSSSSRKAVGEVLLEDIWLVGWRDNDHGWNAIIEAFENSTGKTVSANTLRKRYRMLKHVLEDVDASEDLLSRVSARDQDARDELNRLIHGEWPIPALLATPYKSLKIDHLPSLINSPILDSREAESDLDTRPKQHDNEGHGDDDETEPAAQPRPTTGGKHFNEETFKYYLEAQVETFDVMAAEAEAEANASDDEREESPITDEDYCHFIYQIKVRQLTFVEQEGSTIGIDDSPWVYNGAPFENLTEANCAAFKVALSAPKGQTAIADPDKKMNIESEKDDNGHISITVTSDVGVVQVKVLQLMRSLQDRILPQSKNGWAPKTVWFVKQREMTIPGFKKLTQLMLERKVKTNVDDAVYTTLDQANARAVEHFASLTFNSGSSDPLIRVLEEEVYKDNLIQELKDGNESRAFQKTKEGEGRVVEVMVEAGKLVGPRNF